MKFRQIVELSAIPTKNDLGLFVLRVLIGLNLFLKHGWEKIVSFNNVVARVPDILHIGVGPTIFLAAVSDAGCAVLIILGLATRWASAYSFIVISVAWIARDHLIYFGHNADHGELIALYLSALIAIFITGPGGYSIDARLKDTDLTFVPQKASASHFGNFVGADEMHTEERNFEVRRDSKSL
jgi:putative oxidoreductase